MTKRESEIEIRHFLEELRETQRQLRVAEDAVNTCRDRKWECVNTLKELGHDFTASSEGMDVVLSAPPSMRF